MKLLLFIFVFVGFSFAAQAQMQEHHAERSGGAAPSAAQAEALTRRMTVQLHLNESQIIKLRKINVIKLAQTEEMKWQLREDQPQLQRALQELQSQYEAECGRVLTPSQLGLMREQQPSAKPAPPTSEGGLG